MHTVTGLSGRRRLADVTGAESSVALAELLSAPGFRMVTAGRRRALPPAGAAGGLPAEAAEQARWWERHIVEVITGLSRRRPRPGCRPRPEYDPAVAHAAAAGDGEGRRSCRQPGMTCR